MVQVRPYSDRSASVVSPVKHGLNPDLTRTQPGHTPDAPRLWYDYGTKKVAAKSHENPTLVKD